ncbi:phage holin family protein [Sphingomonas piscis]|uniref:Phage holin family protein n=1 Tax=Sphingomonas piscis TaxID=2714943 RepID=A0A6G7YLL0_9SPHN|nr:phage holin family protein [Sphingomonas piscis]QIK77630.1 phage holin family protein [Sphingomonas piscis]
MLKPIDPAMHPTGPNEERPVGELVHRLVEDGKAYARAEVNLAKAIATAKGKALALPVGLFATAFVLVLAGVTALAVGVVIALAKFVGPLAAGLISLLIFAGIAGLLSYIAITKLRSGA